MAMSLETIAMYRLGGVVAGTVYYLYQNNYLSDFIKGPTTTPPEEEPPVITPEPTVPGTSGQYRYYVKRKAQCRDNHLSFSYLSAQGVRILNYKLYNHKSIRTQMCGAPSALLILIAIDKPDLQSAAILVGLGFIEYYAPPAEPVSTVPIPNPPASSALALVQTGATPSHRAYKVYRR